MIVNKDNINQIEYIYGYKYEDNDHMLLNSVFSDVEDLNRILEERGLSNKKVCIDYIDSHTEYSPERTDPCPDYYGMFTLRFCNNEQEIIGEEMTLDELDSAVCLLFNFISIE